jgi:hypothetical protein
MSDLRSRNPTLTSFGRKGGAITPNNDTDLDPLPKALEVVSEGVLEVLPIDNADGEWVNLGLCTKGYRPPYQVRRVRTTTVAGLVGIWD